MPLLPRVFAAAALAAAPVWFAADAMAADPSDSGDTPSRGAFPENDGSMHMSIQTNGQLQAANDGKPIIEAMN